MRGMNLDLIIIIMYTTAVPCRTGTAYRYRTHMRTHILYIIYIRTYMGYDICMRARTYTPIDMILVRQGHIAVNTREEKAKQVSS